MKRSRQLPLARERGQAAVETAVVMPLLVFTILGILQLTLMQQARLMLEYAGYNAARAGIVWNMDREKMRAAATLTLMPTMPTVPFVGPAGEAGRVDGLGRLIPELSRFSSLNSRMAPLVFGQRVIDVETLNPTRADFGGEPEIEFDRAQTSFAERRRAQLTVRVTYLYELRIPFADRILWESWLAGNAGIALVGINPATPKVRAGFSDLEVSRRVRFLWESASFRLNADYNGISRPELMRIVFAGMNGRYFIPLVTTHTMRMQSNPYRDNALQ